MSFFIIFVCAPFFNARSLGGIILDGGLVSLPPVCN